MSAPAEDGPPAKKARPTSVEDVVLSAATAAAAGAGGGAGGQQAAAGAAAGPSNKSGRGMLTLEEIAGDKLTQLAAQHWSEAARAKPDRPPFSPELVQQIYTQELGGGNSRPPLLKRVMLLEVSQYLEGYLWPHFDPATSSDGHVMSMLVMVNEKFREGVPPWGGFHSRKEVFPAFFARVLALRLPERQSALSQHEQTSYLLFMINAFQSLEDEMVRAQVLKLVSLPVWHSLSPGRLQLELAAQPALAKRWKALLKKEAKAAKAAAAAAAAAADGGGKDSPAAAAAAELPKAESVFMPGMLQEFLRCLRDADAVLTGQQQQQQDGDAGAAAAAAEESDSSSSDSEDGEKEAAAAAAGEGEAGADAAAAEEEHEGAEGDEAAAAAADGDVVANGHANGVPATPDAQPTAAVDDGAGGQQQGSGRGRGRGRGGRGGSGGRGRSSSGGRGRGRGRGGRGRGGRSGGRGRRRGGGGGGGGSRRLGKRLLLHLERFVEYFIDLMSQLPTRRFVHSLLEDQQVLVKAKRSVLYSSPQGALFQQLLDLLSFYCDFPMDDHTGEQLREDDVTARHYDKVCQFQRLLFKYWPQLRELSLSNCASACAPSGLRKALEALGDDELRQLVCRQLRLVGEDDEWAQDRDFLLDVVVSAYQRRASQRAAINAMPLYPTEGLLWDTNQIPTANYSGEQPLALPKLNLQFLSPSDYLLRNFHLFRLEAAYEVREDIQVALQRLSPGRDFDNNLVWRGWSKMATPSASFRITQVSPPRVGEKHPASVLAEVVVDTRGMRGDVASGWDELKQHDVLFLLGVDPPNEDELFEALRGARKHRAEDLPLTTRTGLLAVRGAEVVEVRDEEGGLMNDFTGRVRFEDRKPPKGFMRTFVLSLDPAQYQLDVEATAAGQAPDVYATFNVVMRRDAKENNFKAVLESIRDSLNEQLVIPEWLVDIFLGYGDAGAAHYTQMNGLLRTVDFKDTFLDAQHIIDSFPQYDVTFVVPSTDSSASSSSKQISSSSPGFDAAAASLPPPPYKVTYPLAQGQLQPAPGSTKRGPDGEVTVGGGADGDGAGAGGVSSSNKPVLLVESYRAINMGPYPEDRPKDNAVRFTPVQVEAIGAGVQPGLTMVVGPPGTGKTDTAVQILQVLYHNCPGQRTLLITHSNQALNDLFAKMVARDIPARYLLRLGMGERDLDVDDDFSRAGRVNNMLARRLTLLAEVEKLSALLGVVGTEYTCETAGYFWLLHVLSRWEKFSAAVSSPEHRGKPGVVSELFPFTQYFADAPQPLFKPGASYEDDMEVATGCFRHLRQVFQELEETRPFELLKGQGDRVAYLCTKQAKVVAMTCTHAALKRREFLNLGLKYDNIVMEEAGQVLEVETFIPMVLQRQEDGVGRLKRVILIGDHHQLPPVVQNMAFQKYSRLDQSLFARFVRLGTPYVELNAQGRARPSIARLYNWRYGGLADLPAVTQSPVFQTANPGLAFDYQFIDVPDFKGRGESEPAPYYYQNLGEAEYIVALYSFMRLMGYPAERISILTTYNGQKDLLRDVVEARCARHPLIGRPHKITTVDKYQGQQNDYVLLSLVRSRIVGHLRDVRRLVVALSRARLGLYVFGRQSLFANCFELQPAFSTLLARPTQLALVKGESYTTCSRTVTPDDQQQQVPGAYDLVPGVAEMLSLVERISKEQLAARAAAAAGVPPPRAPPGEPAAEGAAAEGAAAEGAAAAAGGDVDMAEEGGGRGQEQEAAQEEQ